MEFHAGSLGWLNEALGLGRLQRFTILAFANMAPGLQG